VQLRTREDKLGKLSVDILLLESFMLDVGDSIYIIIEFIELTSK
jgi:hypothetical protein